MAEGAFTCGAPEQGGDGTSSGDEESRDVQQPGDMAPAALAGGVPVLRFNALLPFFDSRALRMKATLRQH
ncbi:hypothetical protein GOP47_0000975 [Adiantum capillus-veneris]|uniref:Uncharacterized protein n=1 Tax=Adiantum capillus-veneris TaxID=13818 RepID=A0A9D4ZSS7_ADICA|nr:hypothetical protein GOP47_0000975 [Adiantum capillus-veneris]